MAVSNVYTLGAMVVNGSSAWTLSSVRDRGDNWGIEQVYEHAAGVVDPSFIAVLTQTPELPITTVEIAKALANIGIDGFDIPQTTVYTSADFFLQQIQNKGTRASGSNHRKLAVNCALIVPNQITASQGQPATFSFTVHPIYDDSNEPIIPTADVPLPSSVAITEMFTLGPCSINGTEIDTLQTFTYDFGITVEKISSADSVWPQFAAIMSRQPKIMLNTGDETDVSTYGIDGTAQGGTDSVFYLTKLEKNGTRVANGTAEHISFTVDDGMVTLGDRSGGNNEKRTGDLVVSPSYDGSNAIVAISTATAIT